MSEVKNKDMVLELDKIFIDVEKKLNDQGVSNLELLFGEFKIENGDIALAERNILHLDRSKEPSFTIIRDCEDKTYQILEHPDGKLPSLVKTIRPNDKAFESNPDFERFLIDLDKAKETLSKVQVNKEEVKKTPPKNRPRP